MPTHIPEAHTPFMTDNGDGTISVLVRVPVFETFKVAGHDFTIDNTKVPLASHELRYAYGLRKVNDVAGSAAKLWRDEDPKNRPVGTVWARDDSQAYVDDYLAGTLAGRSSDPVMSEARKMALAHILRAAGCKDAKAGHAHPKAKAYFKAGGKLGMVRDDSAVDAFIHRFDAAQEAGGKPELGFIPRAREIVAARANEGDAIAVEI